MTVKSLVQKSIQFNAANKKTAMKLFACSSLFFHMDNALIISVKNFQLKSYPPFRIMEQPKYPPNFSYAVQFYGWSVSPHHIWTGTNQSNTHLTHTHYWIEPRKIVQLYNHSKLGH